MFSALPDSVNNPLAFCNKIKPFLSLAKLTNNAKLFFRLKDFCYKAKGFLVAG
jgi:hypothetical protein